MREDHEHQQRARLRPRRIISHLVAFLLLGALLNVVVAWSCITWMPATAYEDDEPVAPSLTVGEWPAEPESSNGRHGFGFRFAREKTTQPVRAGVALTMTGEGVVAG